MARLDTVGSTLRQARERSALDLDEVAKAIKVGAHLLEALESNQFDRLPGGPFNKGFVRAYARHVGLDPEASVLAYAREERARGLSTPDADRTRRWDLSHLAMFRIEEDRKTLVLDWVTLRGVLVGALAVGILTFGGWILFRVGWAEQPVLGAARLDTRTGAPTSGPAAGATAAAIPATDRSVARAEPFLPKSWGSLTRKPVKPFMRWTLLAAHTAMFRSSSSTDSWTILGSSLMKSAEKSTQ